MKAIYNIGRENTPYVKEAIKGTLKAVTNTSSTEVILNKNCHEIVDIIDIKSQKEAFGFNKMFSYKPSLSQQGAKGMFNYQRFEQSSILNKLSRSFSTKTMVDRMEKFADPKNDLVFKKLFGNKENKELLIDFINKVLPDKHVQDIEYLPTNMEPEIRIKKQSILDVLCTDKNGSKYIIEMQNAKEKGFEKRAVYYASKTYSTQMDQGGKYADLKEVIFVAITDFIMFPDKKDFISTYSILDNKTYTKDLKDFSFAFIELPKFKKENIDKGVDEWCDLFKNAKNRKTCDSTDPMIKKAYETLEISNWSNQDLLDYQAYEKIQLDNQAREDQLRDEGETKKAIEIAKQMLADKEPIEKIQKYTGLSKEEINKL